VVKIPKLFFRMSEGVQATVTHAMTQIYSDRYKSTYRVQDATREELLHAIKWHLCPSDCQDFNEKLVESCQDYKVQRVEDDFSQTSVKLGKLREKLKRYEFLSEACTLCKLSESIPKLKWKDGGILQVFLELTPEETHEGFKTVLTRVNYSTVEHFLNAYFAVVQDTYAKFDSARIFCRRTSRKLPTMGQAKFFDSQTKQAGKFHSSGQRQFRQDSRRNQGWRGARL
jgi:hypothetical protein